MNRPPPGLEGIPAECYAALDVFTDKELAPLCAWYNADTGLFWCIGYISADTGLVSKWADLEKHEALEVLENQVRKEYPTLPQFTLSPYANGNST